MALLVDDPAAVLRDLVVLSVTGADRHTYLHSLLSQELATARPGEVADFLLLDHTANPLAEGRAVVAAGAIHLLVPRAAGPDLLALLRSRTFLLEAVTTDRSDTWAVASARGPAPVEGLGARPDPMTVVPRGEGFVVRDRAGGVDVVGPAAWVDEAVARAGLPVAAPEDFEHWRILAGIPRWAREITTGRRPQELGLLPTHVHLRKGCYPGQETIAKTFNLGRPRRALVHLAVAAPATDLEGLLVGGRPAEVTSATAAPEGSVVLALARRERDGTVPEDVVTAGGRPGRLLGVVGQGLPLPGAGPTPRAERTDSPEEGRKPTTARR